MNTVFIVNFVGQASPATIKQLAAVTHENGGKWLISKVNFIEDQVAGVIKVELPEENADTVKEAFSACQTLVVKFVDSEPHSHKEDTISNFVSIPMTVQVSSMKSLTFWMHKASLF